MNSQPERVHQGAAGALEPVGPSPIVKVVMRPMTKILNPLIVKLAGRRHFHMAAQIRHVGRRSGRTYTTPVSARRSGDMIVIALTFGNQSDWSRNVRSAKDGRRNRYQIQAHLPVPEPGTREPTVCEVVTLLAARNRAETEPPLI